MKRAFYLWENDKVRIMTGVRCRVFPDYRRTPRSIRDQFNNPIGVYEPADRYDYLTASALARILVPSTPVRLYFLTGPRLDVYLGGKSYDAGPNDIEFSGMTFVDDYKRLAAGGTVGAGIELPIRSAASVLLEFRYDFDATNSLRESKDGVKNSAFDVTLGCSYSPGRRGGASLSPFPRVQA